MIDMSDYYLLIVAGKYGSIDPEENISYTEKEYRYAVAKKMPILAFLHQNVVITFKTMQLNLTKFIKICKVWLVECH